jgi:hypothetical protein
MSFDADRLYALLPAVYRSRDAEQGGPLRALLAVIAEQAVVLEQDLEQLYDDYFIETCAGWVVPYIGDLVGAGDLFVCPDADYNPRVYVASTLAYRRRKGTAAVLEQLAQDVTGWRASVVEFFQCLATTQYLNHLRPEHLAIADLRPRELYRDTPFDRTTHTVEVRNIAGRRGRYNIPNVGIFLWRLDSYSVTDAPAHPVDEHRYLFDALGREVTLYNQPVPEEQITHLAEPVNVPMPLSREVLDRYLDSYYGKGQSLLLNVDGKDVLPNTTDSSEERLTDLIKVCDLSDLKDKDGKVTGWANLPKDKIAIDPVLGRLAFPSEASPQKVRVTYHYGFSARLGGGEYRRANSFTAGLQPIIRVRSSEKPPPQEALKALLKVLLEALNDLAGSGGVVVEIETNDCFNFEEPLTINVDRGKTLELRAAEGRRPILQLKEDLRIMGGENSTVILNGLLVSGGGLSIPDSANKLQRLELRHCTLLPESKPTIKIEAPEVTVVIDRCIVGAISSVEDARCWITNSIVDGGAETAVAYADRTEDKAGASLTAENSTFIGKVHTIMLELASNTIFLGPLTVERLQQGGVRFSYMPPSSRTPRQYHCQPSNPNEAARLRPIFTSLRYGNPGYCQLSPFCAVEIRQGADDQAEMGAFHHLYQPQREANLRARLREYLRFGLEAEIFYVN